MSNSSSPIPPGKVAGIAANFQKPDGQPAQQQRGRSPSARTPADRPGSRKSDFDQKNEQSSLRPRAPSVSLSPQIKALRERKAEVYDDDFFAGLAENARDKQKEGIQIAPALQAVITTYNNGDKDKAKHQYLLYLGTLDAGLKQSAKNIEPPQAPAPHAVSHAQFQKNLQNLKRQFPGIGEDFLRDMLNENKGDYENSLRLIIELTGEQPQPLEAEPAPQQVVATPPTPIPVAAEEALPAPMSQREIDIAKLQEAFPDLADAVEDMYQEDYDVAYVQLLSISIS